ncbi:FAD-dependent oxidoreductase [Terrimonas alba]|uniref:FAD-dependent oxidoreductase n=1 Tax=Terrimonas alba TaxID=3349636 RepID=UPI0035F4914B
MSTAGKSNAGSVITSGENISYWIDSRKPIEFKTLNQNIDTDILIIGGGIAGITTAYCLARAGRNITLVEDGFIGSGETGRTTAHLTCALDDRYFQIEEVYGEDDSRLAAASHTTAIDWIEETVGNLSIDCNFKRVSGYLFPDPSDEIENLQKEFEATRKAGLRTEWLDQIPGISSESGPCIRFPRQGQFHIMQYLNGLANAIERLGGTIYTQTKATDIDDGGAKCNGFKVSAQHVVVATNSPVNNMVAMHTKQFPFRTYVIGAKIPKGTVEPAMWWDTGNQHSKWYTAPYHYVRTEQYDEEFDLLISGGEDHKTGQADDENIPEERRYDRLISWTKEHFPMMTEIIYKWSGQVLEPLDYMAFIGKNPGNKNVYIITGDSGNGMTHGTIGGILISDLIQGKENAWEKIYSPKRLPLKVPGKYLKEMADMAAQYADYFVKADVHETDELKAGEGAILSKGLKRFAVYKDENNELFAFSAVCPHLGCVLQWNADEKSFDCPCHGSRFTKEGKVINGPAIADLKRIELHEHHSAE